MILWVGLDLHLEELSRLFPELWAHIRYRRGRELGDIITLLHQILFGTTNHTNDSQSPTDPSITSNNLPSLSLLLEGINTIMREHCLLELAGGRDALGPKTTSPRDVTVDLSASPRSAYDY